MEISLCVWLFIYCLRYTGWCFRLVEILHETVCIFLFNFNFSCANTKKVNHFVKLFVLYLYFFDVVKIDWDFSPFIIIAAP